MALWSVLAASREFWRMHVSAFAPVFVADSESVPSAVELSFSLGTARLILRVEAGPQWRFLDNAHSRRRTPQGREHDFPFDDWNRLIDFAERTTRALPSDDPP